MAIQRKKIHPYEKMYVSAKTVHGIVDRLFDGSELGALRAFLPEFLAIMEKLIRAKNEGRPLIGHHFAFPSEILQCFDAVPVCFEALSYLTASLLPFQADEYYDSAAASGHPYHTCSSQKGALGAALLDELGLDAIITPSAPCDNTIGTYQYMAKKMNVPLIIPDMLPIHSERGYKYYSEELYRAILQLGRAIGQEPDLGRLQTSISLNNKSLEAMVSLNELRRAIPSPIDSMTNPLIVAACSLMSGYQEKVNFLEKVIEIGKERVKKGEGATKNEKVRSIWPCMSIFFDLSLCQWMDSDLGMNLLMDIFGGQFMEPVTDLSSIKAILRQVAVQNMEYPMTRQSTDFSERLVDDILFLVREYKADCAVFTSHIGCKQNLSLIQILRESLKDELGIPMLVIEVDTGDRRFISLESIKKRLVEFVQTLF